MNHEILFSERPDEWLSEGSRPADSMLIIYCIAGRVEIELDGQTHVMGADDLLLCHAEARIGRCTQTAETRCRLIAISNHALDDILYACTREDTQWWEKTEYLRRHPVMHLDGKKRELAQLFDKLFRLLTDEEEHALGEHIRRILIQAAVFELLIWLEGSIEEPSEPRPSGHPEVLFRRFTRMVQDNRGRQREVQWYAEQLSISPKYLTSVCHTYGGKTALAIIQDVTIREIKRMMLQSDMSTKEIASEMNFVSLSFFCKYFKQHLGITANTYRKRREKR